MEFIDLKAQYKIIEQRIKQRVESVLDAGHYIMGPEVGELESKLQEFTNSKHAITCASGTDALALALRALDIGLGDEVITSAFSFFATAEAICQVGATPVLVDIDSQTYNISVDQIEANITERTKAIMPVSLFGQTADLSTINKIAIKHSLPVIEDAAQSFGATHNDLRSCSATTIGCTSFFPAKPLGCYGDGGACFTNDDHLADKIRSLRVHGKGEDKYDNVRIGMNSRLDTIQAAILLTKLEIYPEELNQRNVVAQRYTEALGNNFITPKVASGNVSVWAQYCLRSSRREEMLSLLSQKSVPTAIYYNKPHHLQTGLKFLGYSERDFPVAEQVSSEIFSVPMHPYLSQEDIHTICLALIR